MGMESAHAGRVILVMDMLEEIPVALNVVPVQLPDHSVMVVVSRDQQNHRTESERKDTCVLQ